MMPIPLIGVTLLASLSPLLTFVRLWQMKEWRFDRLIEHMKQEGILQTFFGISRLLIGILWIVAIIVGYIMTLYEVLNFFTFLWYMPFLLLLPLAIASVLQMLMKRQPLPKWTSKACLMLIVSLLLNILLSIILIVYPPIIRTESFYAEFHDWTQVLVPFIQWLIVMIAWVILRPLDHFLKARIMAKAYTLRARHSELTVIGITGSAGKTTTKELLSHIMAGPTVQTTPAHVNTEMGVSKWLIRTLGKPAQQEINKPKILIIEMGAYRMGEIALLCSIAQPNIGIITSIGEQHISLFGNQENICKAKSELFEALPNTGHAFLNADSAMCDDVKVRAICPVTTVGTGGNGDMQAYDIEETRKGIRCTVDGTVFDIPINGTHNVTNVLLAIACARHMGMTLHDIAVRLRGFRAQKHTFEVRTVHGIAVLDDTYNSSPQSFAAAIDWAKKQPEKNKVLLISGIIELGNREAAIHRELAAQTRHIFSKVYIINKRFLPYFQHNGDSNAMLLPDTVPKVQPGDLLVCIGRMPKSTIDHLLPL